MSANDAVTNTQNIDNKTHSPSQNIDKGMRVLNHNNDNYHTNCNADGKTQRDNHNTDNRLDSSGHNVGNTVDSKHQNNGNANQNTNHNNGNASQHCDAANKTQADNLSAVQNLTTDKWGEIISAKDVLYIISAIKKYGMPDDVGMRGRIFRRLNNRKADDYPVTYDGLKIYFPKLNEYYPEDTLAELVRKFSMTGNYKINIANDKELADDLKNLLLFILP